MNECLGLGNALVNRLDMEYLWLLLLLGKATIFDMGEGLKRLNLARSRQSQVGTSLFSVSFSAFYSFQRRKI